MPFDDSAEPLEESADILRGFRRRAADYLRGRSAEFVKLLVICTVCTYIKQAKRKSIVHVCTYVRILAINIVISTYILAWPRINKRSRNDKESQGHW